MAAAEPEVVPVTEPPQAGAAAASHDDGVDVEKVFQQLLWLREHSPTDLEELHRRLAAFRRHSSLRVSRAPTDPWGGRSASIDYAEEWDRAGSVQYGGDDPLLTGLPLKRTQSGVQIDPRAAVHLKAKLTESKWEPQPVAVVFEDLRVFRNATDDVMPSVTRSVTAPFRACCKEKKAPTQRLGHGAGVTGFVQPGEMLLVLGPPGSGCSTLLRTLAGKHAGVQVQSSRLLYNGHPTLKDAGTRAIYMGEDDIHLAPLSVEKTFRLAAELGTPDEFQVPGMTREEFNDMLVRMMLQLLSLDHVKATVVGDELLRGVSGGEKKRVSIGEAQLMRPSLICLDGWSRGLDSAATLRICKHLRTLANMYKVAVVVSMYQAGPEMLQPGKGFDNVLILTKGRQLYFGPVARAEAYFAAQGIARPPRRTLPDFLATVVDASVRQQVGGTRLGERLSRAMSADDPLQNATEEEHCDRIANKWIESTELDQLRRLFVGTGGHDVLPGSRLQGISVRPIERNPNYVPRKEPSSIGNQLKWLLWREKELTVAFRKQYVNARFGRFVFLALFTGFTFWKLDDGKSGAYSRMGCIYNTMLNLGLGSFSAMPDMISQRNTFQKQKNYNMMRPWAWYLSKFLFDLPFTILDTLFFGGIVYYMVGFQGAFENFLSWLLLLWATNVMSAAFIRMFTCLAPDLSMAQAMSAGSLIILIFFCGFMLPKDSIPVYFKWIYYISPYTYPLHGLLINEYHGLTFKCSQDDLVDLTKNIPFKTYGIEPLCPIRTDGADYIDDALNVSGDKIWILYDFLITLGFMALFILLTCYIVETVDFQPAGSSLRYKAKHEAITATVTDTAMDDAHDHEQSRLVTRASGVTSTQLRWENVEYSVVDDSKEGKGERKVLLHDISGVANPGEMTALMGPSGAGKTTLMDVLALRKDPSGVQGNILLNGMPLTPDMVRCIGYVEQMDMHEPRTTVREALLFSARLRLAQGDPEAKVEEVIQLLGLESVQHAMIGSIEMGGLSLEARKRVTIGVELVTEPRVLFMDEPTSGLDTAGALAVLRCARAVADSGRTVVMTIHQPSSELFEMFDSLCLLQKGGHTAYFGRLHEKGMNAGSAKMIDYFQRNAPDAQDPRYAYTDTQNPADYMLNVLGYARDHWVEAWPTSVEASELKQELEKEGEGEDLTVPPGPSIPSQMRRLLVRTMLVFWRTPTYNVTRNFFAVFTGLLLGLSYWQLGSTQAALHNHVTVIYFSVILGVLNTMNALPTIIVGRPVFYREVSSGTYTQSVYSFCLAVVEVPFFALSALLFINTAYWMCGFRVDWETYWYFAILYFLFVAFTVYFGQLMGAAAPSLMVAQMMIPATIGIWTLFNGFLIRTPDVPDYFKVFNIVNPYTYFLRSMVSNVLHDKTFHCDQSELLGVTWNSSYESLCNHQYNPQIDHYGDGKCFVCPIISGTDFLKFYDWDYDDCWPDVGRLAAFVVAARILSTLLLTYKKHIQR